MLFMIMVILIAIVALLLMLVVLLQSGKGGGLAGIAGGGATRQVLGSRQAPDLLERATWTLAAVFIVLCLLTTFAIDTGGGAQESIIQQRAGEQPATPQQTLPPEGNSQGLPAPEQDGGGEQ